jgi:hypothetical protein
MAGQLRHLANYQPAEARDIIVNALRAARGDRSVAALALRASGYLPPGGTDKRTLVTFYEIVRSLDDGAEILVLCPSPSFRVEGVDYVNKPAAKSTRAKASTTSDATRVIRARRGRSRGECARLAGLKDESSLRNVEKRGMPLAGRLKAWVEQQEAAS